MVNNIPVKFKRTAAAFDDEVAVRVRSCRESSGSEHSSVDLSDLVNSYLERQITSDNQVHVDEIEVDDDQSEIRDTSSPDLELQLDSLKNLFDLENDAVKRSIHAEVDKALGEVVGDSYKSSSPVFNRRLMARLRNRGFDAGLCKSKWEKNGRNPSGNYEYIDVNANNSRYIIEVFLAGEFTIARPTVCYASLLDVFPDIFIGKPDELKQVARLMCNAIRMSMKRVDLNVPPWRHLAYMQAKWLGSYKRTTNEIPSSKVITGRRNLAGDNRFVGFAPVNNRVSLYYGEDFVGKTAIGGRNNGHLGAAFNQKEM